MTLLFEFFCTIKHQYLIRNMHNMSCHSIKWRYASTHNSGKYLSMITLIFVLLRFYQIVHQFSCNIKIAKLSQVHERKNSPSERIRFHFVLNILQRKDIELLGQGSFVSALINHWVLITYCLSQRQNTKHRM